jgi:hypothetical protein
MDVVAAMNIMTVVTSIITGAAVITVVEAVTVAVVVTAAAVVTVVVVTVVVVTVGVAVTPVAATTVGTKNNLYSYWRCRCVLEVQLQSELDLPWSSGSNRSSIHGREYFPKVRSGREVRLGRA